MEIQRKLIKFLSSWRLRVFDESGDCPMKLENLSISLGILIEDWWDSEVGENSTSATGFCSFFENSFYRRWLRFAATESDCDSLMLLNAGLILLWVIVVGFSTCCVFCKTPFERSTSRSQCQVVFQPTSGLPKSSGLPTKEPLILKTSPLDLSNRSNWPPFLEFL